MYATRPLDVGREHSQPHLVEAKSLPDGRIARRSEEVRPEVRCTEQARKGLFLFLRFLTVLIVVFGWPLVLHSELNQMGETHVTEGF